MAKRDLGSVRVKPVQIGDFIGTMTQIPPYTVAVFYVPSTDEQVKMVISAAKCCSMDVFCFKTGEQIVLGRAKKKLGKNEYEVVDENANYVEYAAKYFASDQGKKVTAI